MLDHRFEKAIKEIKNLRMTGEEKTALKNKLLESFSLRHEYGETRRKSMWPIPWSVFYLRHKVIMSAIAVALVIVLGSGGLAMASENSLPGDALYEFKVNVVEPIIGSFASTPAEQAAWQAKLVTNRLSEASKLAGEGRLDDVKEARIVRLLDEHTGSYAVAIEEVERTDSKEKASGIVTTLKASISAHAKLFNDLSVIGTSSEPINNNATAGKSDKNKETAAKFSRKAESHISDIDSSWSVDPLENEAKKNSDADQNRSSGIDENGRTSEGQNESQSKAKTPLIVNTAAAAASAAAAPNGNSEMTFETAKKSGPTKSTPASKKNVDEFKVKNKAD